MTTETAATAQEAAPPTEATAEVTAPTEEVNGAAPLEHRDTIAPALPDQSKPESQPSPEPAEPTAVSATEPVQDAPDDDDELDDDHGAQLPATLEEAHAEIERLRKWKQRNSLNLRRYRDGKKTAEHDAGSLRQQLDKTAAKLETALTERASILARAEAAEATATAATEERERYRGELLSRFTADQRPIAEALPLDKLPAYFEQVNGRALLASEPPPQRHVVTREAASKPKPQSLDEYYG